MVNVYQQKINGLYYIEQKINNDNRGYFLETYNEEEFIQSGFFSRDNLKFVQDNESCSFIGTLRGLHFQQAYPQAKLVRVSKGAVYDVVLDIRENSPSFGRWDGYILDDIKKAQLYIPKGCAHGFLTLVDKTIFTYKVDTRYYQGDNCGILYSDPTLNIDWEKVWYLYNPTLPCKFIVSEKDKILPTFAKYIDVKSHCNLANLNIKKFVEDLHFKK